MSYILNRRETQALERLDDECRFLEGDFIVKGKLGRGIDTVTLDNLKALGLIEEGKSNRYHGSVGYRITADGERCLFGGLTWEEIRQLPEGTKISCPNVKRWPPA